MLLEVEELTLCEGNSAQVPAQLAETLNTSIDSDSQLKRDTTTANVVPGSPVPSALLPTDTEYVKDSLENTGKHTEKTPLLNKTSPEPSKSPTSATEKERHDALSLLGQPLYSVTQAEYYKICAIIKKPEVQDTQLTGFIGKILPYVLQRVKMRGCHVLQPSRLSALVRSQAVPASKPRRKDPFSTKSSTADRAEIIQYECPVSRLDCLTCLLGTVDRLVAKDLLAVMSQFPMAFPLIMRNIAEEGRYSLMTPLLRGIVVKWESESGKIIEHSLFNDPFKVLVAVRLGENSVGKSTILNQILAKEHTFSTRAEPGSQYGKPAMVDGSVEFIWLTQETCKDTLWNAVVSHYYRGEESAVILLASLHGEANENPDIITVLSRCFQCRYLAFIMPTCSEIHWKAFTSMLPSEDHVSAIWIDQKDYDVSDPSDIQTSRITEDATLHKVRCCLDEALRDWFIVQNVGWSGDQSCSVRLADGIETKLSQEIVAYVENRSCKSTKEELQLQSQKSDKPDKYVKPSHVIMLFIRILKMSIHERQQAVIHLENEMSRLCNAETQTVRQRLLKLKAELREAMVDLHSNSREVERIRRTVTDTLKILDSMNLGLEHFFREAGYLYQLELTRRRKKADNLMLPQKAAELFLNGHPIELLNGDAGEIQTLWLNAIFDSIAKEHPRLRVYVISIIGLQSSGKSTLLNFLFACRFAVSVGRCSRGLFMRLLFLDKEVAKKCKVDAVLLIDSEGLGSPEKMGDLEAEKKDRLLATLAMGISNLAIINVLGEYMKEMTEILQIAIVTMTRLEKVDIAPDILLVQHLLTEKNSAKLCQSDDQFCAAIRKAIDLAEKKDVRVGVRNAKCLSELLARIRDGTLLTQFHSYKDGATANAPASEAYHDDVVSLYEKILRCCKSSTTVIEFKKWRALVESYWQCVKEEDFALRFKNIQEIYDFIDRGQRIAQVKQAIEAAFSAHARECTAEIAAFVQDFEERKSSLDERDRFSDGLKKLINEIPQGCLSAGTTKCEQCSAACERETALYEYVQHRPYETETKSTIDDFVKLVRRSTVRKLSQSFDGMVMKRGCYVEFDNIITDHLKLHLSSGVAGNFTSQKKKRIIDEIFEELSKTASAKDNDTPVKEKIRAAILRDYRHMPDITDQVFGDNTVFEDIFTSNQSAGQRLKNWFVETFTDGAKKIQHLKSTLDDIIGKMLELRQAECYEDSMVSELRHKLGDVLETVSVKSLKLCPKNKISIQIYALQQFIARMERMQDAWDKQNKASSILQENRQRYTQIINARLDHGFGCFSEGQIIGRHLLQVIQKKAIDAENTEKILAVKGLVWTTNSETVRLKYFRHMAEKVKSGDKDEALAYFLRPTKHIERWFKTTVDEHRSKSFGEVFRSTYEQEYESVLRKVRNATDSENIVSIAKAHSADLESFCYQPSSNFSHTANPNELEVMKEALIGTMEEHKEEFGRLNRSLFSRPSDDASVMSRLGCTERCHWCDALCWGQRGHEQDQGETRKHHSSHQPLGLAGTGDKVTNHLISMPCHEVKDENIVYFGEYREEAKENHFNDWKFDRHYNSKFDELMRWFFQELHESIASLSESRKPATTEDLKKYNCTDLDFDDIMIRTDQAIN